MLRQGNERNIMKRAFAKSGRINQVERLLLSSRAHLSQSEIARRCEVNRSTIGRLIQDMIDAEIPLRQDEQGLWYIERTAYISTIKLRLDEAVALYLAGRLLARYSDKPNAHTVEALSKLGVALQGVMPNLGDHIARTSNDLRIKLPKQVQLHQRVLETMTRAWADGKKVQITYRALHSRRSFQHTFAPYLLEPSAIGYSTYAIGLAEPPDKLRTRKLERIERISLTDEPFDVPPTFGPNKLLAGAWNIWFDEDDQPTTITARFSRSVARRVAETIWHPSQRVEEDSEGRLIWTAQIDAVQEILPWIRGWGADCEVLEPREVRDEIKGEIHRLMRSYGIATADATDRQQRFNDIFG
jgi:predicted DNA-binding transcriptional regulator YafY